MSTIGIVTGASSGIGAEFCRRLDALGLDCIWLIARRVDRMEEVASSLKTSTRLFSVDLTDRESISVFGAVLQEESPEISYLINSAGFGKFGMTWEIPLEETQAMIDLNVTATVTLTTVCIPYMKKGSHIIIMDSASAYVPMYDLNIYASTKAFVRHFCNGLRKELEPKGISVTEVSPGWVRTEFIDITMEHEQVPKKVFNGSVSKEDVVDAAMIAARKGKRRSVCGARNKIVVFLSTHFPNFAAKVWRGQFGK